MFKHPFLRWSFPIMLFVLYLTLFCCWIVLSEYFLFNALFAATLLVMTAIYLYFRRSAFIDYIKAGEAKEHSLIVAEVSLYFFILLLLNYFAFRFNYSVDLSPGAVNTLSIESKQLLGQLKGVIQCRVYVRRGESKTPLPLLELYHALKREWIMDVIDPDLHPEKVALDEVVHYGTIVLEWEGKKALVTKYSEVAISEALLNLTRKVVPSLVFSKGHGELDLTLSSGEGGEAIQTMLKNYRYQMRDYSFMADPPLDPLRDILLILGPKKAFSLLELDRLKAFLERGGKLFLALDPDINEKGSDQFEVMVRFFSQYGVQLSNNVVLEGKNFIQGSQGTVPAVKEASQYAHHPITHLFEGETFFPLVRGMKLLEEESDLGKGFEKVPVVTSSPFPESWSKREMRFLFSSHFAYEDGDEKGPFAFAIALKEKVKKWGQKMVFWGTAQGLKNYYKEVGANSVLFLNSISWLSDEEFIISKERSGAKATSLFVNQYQLSLLFYLTMVVAPLLLVLLAIFFFLRRRRF